MENNQKKINLELTIDQLNLILTSLGKMPYEVSVNLINTLVKTAEQQINQQ
jgi:hypothetical protein